MIIVLIFHVVLFLEKEKGISVFCIKICLYSHTIKNQQIVFSYNKKTSN
jgi:hypothetical protein